VFILPDVLWVLVLGQHAGILGVVLCAAVVYLPSSPPGVAVGPDMSLVFGEHHLVSAGHDRVSCSHRT
jgi:riboflavin transporter FmnP